MPTLTSIRAALLSKLQTLTGSGQKIAYVYDEHVTKIDGYPAITFEISGNQNDFLTNRDNVRVLAFEIAVYVDVAIDGLDQSKSLLDAATDDVMNLLEDFDNKDLDGAIDWMEATVGRRVRLPSPQGDVVIQILTLKCHYIFST